MLGMQVQVGGGGGGGGQGPQQGPVIVSVTPGGQITRTGVSSPNQVYEAFRNQREELGNQVDRLEDQRENLVEQLAEPTMTAAAKAGIEARIATIDGRIAAIDRQLAEADAAVARAAAVPGAIVPPAPEPPRPGPPEEFWVIAGIFMFVVVFPLTIAYARRIWRRGAAVVASLPQEIYERFSRVEQSLDAIAVEVERIGEGQRFLTRMHAEQRNLPAGQEGDRVEARLREGERR